MGRFDMKVHCSLPLEHSKALMVPAVAARPAQHQARTSSSVAAEEIGKGLFAHTARCKSYKWALYRLFRQGLSIRCQDVLGMSEVVRPTMDPVRLLPPFSGCHPSFVIDLNLSIVHCGVQLPTGLLK